MARLIDADIADVVIIYDKINELTPISEVREYIKRQKAFLDKFPTIDAVPVVRCRDCKFGVTPYGDEHDGWIECSNIHGRPLFGCNDFCSYGERKDGDGNG